MNDSTVTIRDFSKFLFIFCSVVTDAIEHQHFVMQLVTEFTQQAFSMQLDRHANIQTIIMSDCDHKITLAMSFLPFM